MVRLFHFPDKAVAEIRHAAVAAEVEVDKTIRLLPAWCAADGGPVISPDGALNQLEDGIIQAASWSLKEGVRLDTAGISSRDWETYPVPRFVEMPEIGVALVNPVADLPPSGSAKRVAPDRRRHRQCRRPRARARIRDLPMTRNRVMAALLKV
jgi:nicotinate dehydrogenase subunit B